MKILLVFLFSVLIYSCESNNSRKNQNNKMSEVIRDNSKKDTVDTINFEIEIYEKVFDKLVNISINDEIVIYPKGDTLFTVVQTEGKHQVIIKNSNGIILDKFYIVNLENPISRIHIIVGFDELMKEVYINNQLKKLVEENAIDTTDNLKMIKEQMYDAYFKSYDINVDSIFFQIIPENVLLE